VGLLIASLTLVAAACGSGDSGDSSAGSLTLGPGATFSSSNQLTDPATVWEGALHGLIDSGPSEFNDETGRCLVLIGTATATSGPSGPANSTTMRPLWVEFDNEWVLAEDNACDTTEAQAAGYDWLLNMNAPVGTPFAFFAEFFAPGNDSAKVTKIAYGNPVGDDSATLFDPTILTAIPSP